jgi:hypothetical protein
MVLGDRGYYLATVLARPRSTSMTTGWLISSAAERLGLGSGNRGETSFTVTNPGSMRDRVVFELIAGDGADPAWFGVEEPQRLVEPGASVTYVVRVVIPPGAPAGSYTMQARAYSADAAPEEGSRVSGRVAFEVKATAKQKTPWWPYAVAAGLVVVVLGVVGFFVFRDKPPANDCIEGFVWREAVPGDHVCVIPARRQQAIEDNAQADSRRSPTGGDFGVNTCVSGFVWRTATPEDLVCVTPQTRAETLEDNGLAESRRRTG